MEASSGFRANFDALRINNQPPDPSAFAGGALVLNEGDRLDIHGWAVDRTGAPVAVDGIVGDVAVIRNAFPTVRQDVATALGVPNPRVGFVLSVKTGNYVARDLVVRVMARSAQGEQAEIGRLAISVRAKPNVPAHPQIVVAGAPRSGCRNVRAVLARYYGITAPSLTTDDDAEHMLSDDLFNLAAGKPFVWVYHPLGRAINIETIERRGVIPVVTWRNLADVIISTDDHFLAEGDDLPWKHLSVYIGKKQAYRAMPAQARYEYQIRQNVPWYLSFWLSWHDAKTAIFTHYERMVRDPMGFYREIVQRVDGRVDELRLASAVSSDVTPESGLNVGEIGRGARLISDENKALLEATIRAHPCRELLAPLIDELPWNVPVGAAL